MNPEPMFAEQEDDPPPPGPSVRWYAAAAVLLVVGLTLSLLIGRSAANQIDPQPAVAADGTVELPDARTSVFVARRSYDSGAQCMIRSGGGAAVPLDYGVEAGERTIDEQTYVRVGQTPQGVGGGTYSLDCGDIDAEDIMLTSTAGLGGVAGLLIASVLVGVGLTVLALMIGILVAVLRTRARRTPRAGVQDV